MNSLDLVFDIRETLPELAATCLSCAATLRASVAVLEVCTLIPCASIMFLISCVALRRAAEQSRVDRDLQLRQT